MAFKIITSISANRDISISYDYYLNVAGEKVANRFFKDFKNSVKILSRTAHFEKIYENFHRLPLKKFPFILIYKIDKDKGIIKIYRVFHTSQNPEKYPKNN